MFSIPEPSNDVIFQNYFEQLLLKTPRSNQLYYLGAFIISLEHNFKVCNGVCFQ